jgi:hypothetical protein
MRQSMIVLQHSSVIRRPERFVEVRRAIPPYAEQAIRKLWSFRILYSLQAVADSLCDGVDHALAS